MRDEVVGLSYRLFSTSLADAHLLTAHPASTGARFRLLHLALSYCRAQQAAARGKPCPLPVVLLYEQVGWGWVEGAGLWAGQGLLLLLLSGMPTRVMAGRRMQNSARALLPCLPPRAGAGGGAAVV